MSESGAFCPECGEPVPADRERERSQAGTRRERSLCDSCYFERFDLVEAPERVEVLLCGRCGAVRRGNRWVDVGARDYTDVAVDAVANELGVHLDAEAVDWTVEPEQVDETTIRMHCQFSGLIHGNAVEEDVVVPVKLSKGTCTRCGRIAGGSYASVVQVRALDRDPTNEEVERAEEIARELVADREADGDRDAFVTDVEAVDDGLDVKLSTTQLGRVVATQLTREFGGRFEDHETLVTEDEDGNEVYRVTYAVRLPPYRPGTVIDPEDGDGPVFVRSVQGNLKGVRVATGEEYEARFEDGDAPDARRLGDRSDATRTTVVAVEDERAVRVLDPGTYQATTVPKPEYMDEDAEEVPVLRSRAGLHVLPEE